MIRRSMLHIGRILFWLAWPAYQVYFRRGARTRVLIVVGDDVLIIKGWINDGSYLLAGGGLHRAEDPLAGALREVREETGLQLPATDVRYLGEDTYRRAGLHFQYHMFFATADRQAALTLQRHEIAEARWVPIADLPHYRLSQEVHHCLAAARDQGLLSPDPKRG